MTNIKTGRNEKCGCGSGRKFKQCCGAKAQGADGTSRILFVALAAIIAAAIFFGISAARHDSSGAPAAGQVWSAEHGHYH
jgi:hypothetical protein